MDNNDLIQLTTNLYRLTLLFPKKEPLRYKMRELADEILADSLRITNQSESTNKTEVNQHPRLVNSVLKDFEVLDSFFEVAKNQNWVSPSAILEIQKEYSKIKEELEEYKKVEKIEIVERVREDNPETVPTRQQKILEILREKDKIQVWELKKIFPEVTKRTLRRDFEQLLKQGLVERIGERNETFYQLKG